MQTSASAEPSRPGRGMGSPMAEYQNETLPLAVAVVPTGTCFLTGDGCPARYPGPRTSGNTHTVRCGAPSRTVRPDGRAPLARGVRGPWDGQERVGSGRRTDTRGAAICVGEQLRRWRP